MGADNVTLGDDTDNPLPGHVSRFGHVKNLLIGKIVEGVHDGADNQHLVHHVMEFGLTA